MTRRLALVAAAVAAIAVLAPRPAAADVDANDPANFPDVPFVITQPALSWRCVPLTIYVDHANDPHDPWVAEDVEKGIAEFIYASPHPWTVTDDPTDATVVIRWDPALTFGRVIGQESATNDGRFFLHSRIGLSPRWQNNYEAIVEHELGHTVDLGHTSAVGSIMGPLGPHTGRTYNVGDLIGLRVADWRCHRRQTPPTVAP